MRLVKNVVVGRTWYGPAHGNADQVPADVAEQITNPAAWEQAQKPSRSDSKAVWVDYAVSQGADRAEAEATSKTDLVETFGD